MGALNWLGLLKDHPARTTIVGWEGRICWIYWIETINYGWDIEFTEYIRDIFFEAVIYWVYQTQNIEMVEIAKHAEYLQQNSVQYGVAGEFCTQLNDSSEGTCI